MIIKIVRAENLPASDVNGTSDPFVKVLYDGKEVAATPKIKRDLNPRWDAVVSFPLMASSALYVTLEVWDRDELSANDLLGALRVPFPDWRVHVDEYVKKQQLERQRTQTAAQQKTLQLRDTWQKHQSSGSNDLISSFGNGGMELQRKSQSLNSQRSILQDGDALLRASYGSSANILASSIESLAIPEITTIKPVLIWSRLIKGTIAQGRILCSIQYEEDDLKYLVNEPYGTNIQDVFLPQNPRFKQEYCHLPRSWHPDFAVRQQELSAMHAGVPKDCLFPWHEKILHMVEEVAVTFHVNESNQGVLATLVLTNYRVWFVPYKRVKGLIHEDVHTIPIGKILKATITQQKRSNFNNVAVLELENMDAGHYRVTLSPISRLRESVRDKYSRDAEAKRIKELYNLVAEMEWLRLENSFCATTDLNHTIADEEEEKDEDDLRYYTPRPGGAARPPALSRAMTEQIGRATAGTKAQTSFRATASAAGNSKPANGVSPLSNSLQYKHQHSASPSFPATSNKSSSGPYHFAGKRRIQYHAEREFRRQGVFNHPRWRHFDKNDKYAICATYPNFLVVPASLSDDIISEASRFRSKNRFPALTWIHPRTGAPLCRSSQPNTGVLRSTNQYDKGLIWAIRDAAIPAEAAWKSPNALPKKSSVLHIVDARPELNAKSNALTGKGHESTRQYDRDGTPMASITFMGIDNIHVVRSSFAGLVQALYDVEDANFFGAVQKSRWLEHVCNILQGASEVAMHLERGDAVLVHCSDGWDRTAQLSALAQLMLDPYYRTLEGFAILVEKDWCSFGHMFKKRCGHPTSDQTSPIFPQFLDAVYQLTLQFPTHFQFNELFLSTVAEAVYSSWHGTFQANSERERRAFLDKVATVSVWDVIRASTDQFLNPLFIGAETTRSGQLRMEPMVPVCRVRLMQLWSSQYQKAISHMRLQQREFEMLSLIRQQETELSRLYAVLTDEQQQELRAFQLRSDIASLARSMNLEYPELADDDEEESKEGDSFASVVTRSISGTKSNGKRAMAASVDFHDLVSMATAAAANQSSSNGSSVTQDQQHSELSSSAAAGALGAPTSQSSNVPNARRRKSITSRSRSNSLKLKNSILNMMGQMTGSHENGGAPDSSATSGAVAAAAVTPAPVVSTVATTRSNHGNSPDRQQKQQGWPRQRPHDASRREIHRLEEQLAKMTYQIVIKEDDAKATLRRFRQFNYNLPDSVAGLEYDSGSPTHNDRGMYHQRSSHRNRNSSNSERFNSPNGISPSSSSSQGSTSSSASGAQMNGRLNEQSSSTMSFLPGSSPLLTGNCVVAAGSFRNSQPVWERDGDAPCCKRCKKKFKTFYRNRHHCRCCGYVFCGRCTSNRMNLPEFGYHDVVRVCNICYNSGEDG
ncbi:Myotubularin-like protein, partial [Globisporangium splendens]